MLARVVGMLWVFVCDEPKWAGRKLSDELGHLGGVGNVSDACKKPLVELGLLLEDGFAG